MQRVMLASWWDTLKSWNPINCLIMSNNKSLLDEMYGLMRIIPASSYWMPLLYYCRMIPLMLSWTLVLLFHFSFLQLDSRTLFLFWLEHRPMSRLVHWYIFWLVYCLHRLKSLWLLIDLLQWKMIHMFLVYPDGLPRQLKLLDLMSVMFPPNKKLEVKRNMLVLHWWLVFLKIMILLSTRMFKDDMNGNSLCRQKLILCWRITLGT